jgi:hypothetical protein
LNSLLLPLPAERDSECKADARMKERLGVVGEVVVEAGDDDYVFCAKKIHDVDIESKSREKSE